MAAPPPALADGARVRVAHALSALVEIRGLRKSYWRGAAEIPVLDGLDLSIRARRVRRADGAVGLGQVARCST